MSFRNTGDINRLLHENNKEQKNVNSLEEVAVEQDPQNAKKVSIQQNNSTEGIKQLSTKKDVQLKIELVEKFKIISACVQNFIKLSVTGLPPGGGSWMKNKSATFAKNAKAWVNGEVPCFNDYPGLPTPTGFSPDKNLMPRTNLAKFKNEFINPNETKGEFSFESCTEQEIVGYLNRCRVARYGDCDAHALETAILLIHSGTVDPNHVHIINDQKWGHTFVRITPHEKCPFECVVDTWGDNVVANAFLLKQYNNPGTLQNGTPALKNEETAEAFIRKPENIERYINVLMRDDYDKKITHENDSENRNVGRTMRGGG